MNRKLAPDLNEIRETGGSEAGENIVNSEICQVDRIGYSNDKRLIFTRSIRRKYFKNLNESSFS